MGKITLFDYQEEQIKKGLQGQVLNQSEVGTGKTFVGLEIFKQSGLEKLLIVCLAKKVDDFAEDGKLVNLVVTPLSKGTAKNKTLLKEAKAVSISFESVWRLKELEKWVDNKTMILIDESHKVKNAGSKVSAFVEKLSKKANFSYLMSATMVSNGKYEEYYQQLKIAGVYEGTFKDFKNDYCVEELQNMKVKGRTVYFNEIIGYTNTDQLDNLIQLASVYKKREKDDKLLPEDVFLYVKKPTMYGKLLKNRVIDFGTHIEEYDNLPKLRHGLLQLCSGVLKGVDKPLKSDKLDYVRDILTSSENKRVVIFYNYVSELNALKQLMKSLKRPYSEFNGETHDLKAFKNNNDGVALVQYLSGSTGVNDFVISNICIFFSQCVSSSLYIQAKGRIDRHGQTKKPIYYHLICDKSVEMEAHKTVMSGKDFTDKQLEKLL